MITLICLLTANLLPTKVWTNMSINHFNDFCINLYCLYSPINDPLGTCIIYIVHCTLITFKYSAVLSVYTKYIFDIKHVQFLFHMQLAQFPHTTLMWGLFKNIIPRAGIQWRSFMQNGRIGLNSMDCINVINRIDMNCYSIQ